MNDRQVIQLIRENISPAINEVGVQAFAREAAANDVPIDATLVFVRLHIVDQLGAFNQ